MGATATYHLPSNTFSAGTIRGPPRSAGLEVTGGTENRRVLPIVLLEKVAAKPRRLATRCRSEPSFRRKGHRRPQARLHWWRMDEFARPRAVAIDEQGNRSTMHFYEDGGGLTILKGPQLRKAFHARGEKSTVPLMFAGGRLTEPVSPKLGKNATRFPFGSGTACPPTDSRPVQRLDVKSRDAPIRPQCAHGDHFGAGGTSGESGSLAVLLNDAEATDVVARKNPRFQRWTWRQATMVRKGEAHPSLLGRFGRNRDRGPRQISKRGCGSTSSSADATTTTRTGRVVWTKSPSTTGP